MPKRITLSLVVLGLVAIVVAVIVRASPTDAPAPPPGGGEFTLDVGDRTGPLVDEVVFTQEADQGKVVELILAGSHHAYASSVDNPTIFRRIRDAPRIAHAFSYGTSDELSLNPAGPRFNDGRINPFHVPAIREAMNWLIDRQHIAEELYGGLAVPRYLPLHTAMPDYARLADHARQLELHYQHDPDRARRVIEREMRDLGAERRDGRWFHDGERVEIIVLIRNDDVRVRVGDYVANLVEDLGFSVRRLYRNAQEASRLWVAGDPSAGQWHVYTGAWIKTFIERDLAEEFSYYYTPMGRADPLWQVYEPVDELTDIASRLERRDYRTWDERQEMMVRATELAMEMSVRVWLVDRLSVWPRAQHVDLAVDLAGGVSGSRLWPYTLRFNDRLGGRVVLAISNLLTEPWNPIAGSNWVFDLMIMRALSDHELIPDPYTGLYRPQRVTGAEVTVHEDVAVISTHDWLTVDTAERIDVPDDAWIDWDARRRAFITVGDKHPDGVTARTRVRVEYEPGYLERRWHDGSTMSLADMIFPWILTFERADADSPLYDPAYVPDFEVFREHFRGWRIVSREPLVIEIYSDQIYPDAETIVGERTPSVMPWHMMTLAVLAERNEELAFSSNKADRLGIDWLSMVSGPSMAILDRHLAAVRERAYVPYPNVLGDLIDSEQARERYDNLARWRGARRHFWVGDGPFYLHAAYPVERSVVLRRYERFPDPSDKWLRFTQPRIAELDLDGPMVVESNESARFELRITVEGEPYPAEDIETVQFMLFDGLGDLAHQGEASRTEEDGLWTIELSADDIEALGHGANSIEVAVTARPVALPAFATHAFATVP